MRALATLLLALWGGALLAAELRVSVDREQLFEDESLSLRVQLLDGSAERFDPQLDDFEILQRSQGSQLQIINGRRSDSQTWEFALAPRRAGRLRIPAFELAGARSEAIDIEVESAAVRAQLPEQRPFFLRVSVSEERPFVQQQVIYTMKLYQQQAITDGNVTEPSHADVLIERLGLDRSYHEEVDGRRYTVLERRYALFPQRSGEIVLPSINLNARVQVGQRSNRFFAPNTRSIRVRAPSLALQVQPAPAAYSAAWWLASTELLGSASWQPESAKLGEPLTLEVSLSAAGVMPAQLPELADPVVPGARLYPNGSRAAKQAGAEGVVSQRVASWTVVPTRPGPLEVAAFRLPWWDLQQGRQRTLEIAVPALVIAGDGVAAPEGGPEDESTPASTPVEPAPAAPAEPEAAEPAPAPRMWFRDWRTQLVLVSIVAFAALVIRRRRRRPLPLQTDEQLCSPDAALVRLVEAVTRADLRAGSVAMLDWGSGTFKREIRSLPALAARLDDAELARLVLEMDELRYKQRARWRGEPLLERVKAYRPAPAAPAQAAGLPRLS